MHLDSESERKNRRETKNDFIQTENYFEELIACGP